ncbi:MAG: DUF932 domain-containing protein [Desulfuromonadaceae bacterium]|nr:DUF932 domain-containing protein [Desulfuromonadaceae bacterium]
MMKNNVKIPDTEKWFASPTTSYEGSLEEVRAYVPKFEKRTFGSSLEKPIYRGEETLFESPIIPSGVNPYYDTIVRLPLPTETEVPVVPIGIVSPQYCLLQHHQVFDEVLNVLPTLKVQSEEITTQLKLTPFGERMHLSLVFPERYGFSVTNPEDKLFLRLECFNSVEGSARLMIFMSWLRLVCSNGMMIVKKRTEYQKRHDKTMEIGDIGDILKDGIATVSQEKKRYLKNAQRLVTKDTLQKWVNGPLAKRWGVKAAVRTWHILQSGHDVVLADPFEKGLPTEKTVINEKPVPGAVLPGNTVYAVVQALAWLAKERKDIQEQLVWKEQIDDVIQPLLKKKAA